MREHRKPCETPSNEWPECRICKILAAHTSTCCTRDKRNQPTKTLRQGHGNTSPPFYGEIPPGARTRPTTHPRQYRGRACPNKALRFECALASRLPQPNHRKVRERCGEKYQLKVTRLLGKQTFLNLSRARERPCVRATVSACAPHPHMPPRPMISGSAGRAEGRSRGPGVGAARPGRGWFSHFARVEESERLRTRACGAPLPPCEEGLGAG